MTELNYSEWTVSAHTHFALTISDLMKLNPFDKLEVLILDRDVWPMVLQPEFNQPNVPHDPMDFFRENFGIYIHHYDASGQLFIHNILMDKFEFHIEYKPGYWYPLLNSYLPKSDIQNIYGDFGFGKEMHYKEFDPDTKIGYRGPMILKSNLKFMPKIYWVGSSNESIKPTKSIKSDDNFSLSSISSEEADDLGIININFNIISDSGFSSSDISEPDMIELNAESDAESDIEVRFSLETDSGE